MKSLAESVKTKVKFIPHQSIAVARKIISEADMGIVSLQDEVIKYAYPSKTMTYLAEGTPIIVNVDGEYEISKFVKNYNIGISISFNNKDEIYSIYEQIASGALKYNRDLIKQVFDDNLSKNQFDEKMKSLFKNILEEL